MMKAFGYEDRVCSRAILGAYRPVAYVGFAIGTGYQYALLKMVMTLVFADIENMPEYTFDGKALVITLIAFIAVYELVMYFYYRKVRSLFVKSVMLEQSA